MARVFVSPLPPGKKTTLRWTGSKTPSPPKLENWGVTPLAAVIRKKNPSSHRKLKV